MNHYVWPYNGSVASELNARAVGMESSEHPAGRLAGRHVPCGKANVDTPSRPSCLPVVDPDVIPPEDYYRTYSWYGVCAAKLYRVGYKLGLHADRDR